MAVFAGVIPKPLVEQNISGLLYRLIFTGMCSPNLLGAILSQMGFMRIIKEFINPLWVTTHRIKELGAQVGQTETKSHQKLEFQPIQLYR